MGHGFRVTAWSVIVSLLLPLTAVWAETEEEALAKEAERIEKAYNSFTDEDYERMKGGGIIRNVVDDAYSVMERLPLIGEATRNFRDTDARGFSEQELTAYLNTPSPQKNTQQLMKTLMREHIGYIQRVAAADIPMEKKAELVQKVNGSFSKSFTTMTSYFDNYIEGPESLAERRGSYGPGAWEATKAVTTWSRDWLLHKGQYIIREVTALFRGEAIPLPFIQGRQERRTDTVQALASDIRHAVRAEAARVRQLQGGTIRSPGDLVLATRDAMEKAMGRGDDRNAEQVAMSVVAIEEMLKATEGSETVQYGMRQRWVRRCYMGLALLAFYFGGPEVGPIFGWTLGFAERTTVGPILAMIQWTGLALWAGRSRRQNSGLDYHKSLYGGILPVNLPLVGRRGLYDELHALEISPALAPVIPGCRAVYGAAGGEAVVVAPAKPRRTFNRSR